MFLRLIESNVLTRNKDKEKIPLIKKENPNSNNSLKCLQFSISKNDLLFFEDSYSCKLIAKKEFAGFQSLKMVILRFASGNIIMCQPLHTSMLVSDPITEDIKLKKIFDLAEDDIVLFFDPLAEDNIGYDDLLSITSSPIIEHEELTADRTDFSRYIINTDGKPHGIILNDYFFI